jgi:hypothetical protein
MLPFFSSQVFSTTKHKCGILFSFVGFAFWVFLVLTTRIWWSGPEYSFGLFQVLPIWFWIALFFQVAGLLLTLDSKSLILFLVQISFLNLIVLGTAVLVEPNARVNDTWMHAGTLNTIMNSGRIHIQDANAYWYLQYLYHLRCRPCC